MKTTIRAFVATVAATAAIGAHAATQGNVGATNSSGTSLITLEVGSLIVVKGLEDITLTTAGTPAGTDIATSGTLCVGGVGFSGYSIELDSTNGGADSAVYQLSNGTDTIDYLVAFDDDENSASGVSPTADGSIAGFTNLGTLGCTTDNAKLFVTVEAAEWESITDTTNLTDTLTVTVSGN
ncbi:hypothetical protein [Microbulbifer guangxiensis]|uniref:hypothetical protein n=1 Tax=Microbulbifer guangxiensis TaxID=2904249 RepID=UPI001F345F40|nr:hypothetical protein [Microbulbifer guangxiensis]